MKDFLLEPIGNEFSKEKFLIRVSQPQQMQMLAESLQNAIQRRLHPHLLREIEAIVEELNGLGHDLELRYEPYPGDIHYRDVRDGRCDLLVACDCVVTVSYGEAMEE